ncbi:LPS translocon maturation chaperone LptM [Uliginosibacterium flavum]|uniref:Lipoprotein n=1 Tax=Uliginosibacterium flavum TaxID=1396831 RepID=A0ABV2THJ2_9RHOO
MRSFSLCTLLCLTLTACGIKGGLELPRSQPATQGQTTPSSAPNAR